MAKTIMIVDDEKEIRDLIEMVLKSEGFKLIKASNGKDCLTKLNQYKPDLILLDFFMPDMSGRQVLEEIRKNPKTKNLKVAFLTVANFSNAGVKEIERMKALDYIKKPFKPEELVKRVKALSK
ncbi:MAG: response regulator [Nanoarchaeota archaeon]|nr:response regulator [Nanoarchaeota archaeon]